MFTGIIETTAKILKNADGVLTLARPSSFSDVHLGGSICVAGACLTVTAFDESSMSFEVVPETFEKTALGSLKPGDNVNLERSLKSNGRFDGHIVQGHIEGTAEVLSLSRLSSIPQPLPPGEEGGHRRKTPTGKNILRFARDMRSNPTNAEKILWDTLRYDQLGVRFRRQYPLGGRILDFYCPSQKLNIEVDGEIHGDPKTGADDQMRDEHLWREHQVRTIRISNAAIQEDIISVLRCIRSAILSPPLLEEGLGVEDRTSATLTVRMPAALCRLCIPKGSVTLDGVSLTVADAQGDTVTVALIPTTLRETTLGALKEGMRVNVETDILGRYIAALLSKP